MIYGIGIDITETIRIKNSIENYGQRFLDRIFTKTEQEYCELFGEKKYVHYAARFAAKEAFSKAIGTGITKGFQFKDVGVKNEESGKPVIVLDGNMLELYSHLKTHITLSHTDNNAVAAIIIET